MFSSITINSLKVPKSLFLSTPFLPNNHHHHHQHHHHHSPPPLHSKKPPPHPFSITALILPNSYSQSSKKQQSLILPRTKNKDQQLYQPYRPPPSPLPSQYRSLDTNGRLDILTNRLGRWFEYAPLITSIIQEGFTSSTIEEITGIASREQNSLVVAAQVRDSLLETMDNNTVSFFDSPNSPDILYEIRILNTLQRAVAAQFIIDNNFDRGRAEELARSMKDYPRRHGDRGWECFDGNSPGDCLGFMYFRQAYEHRSASFPEFSKATLERALEIVETEKAKERVISDLESRVEDDEVVNVEIEVKVPVVRMAVGEVAESSMVVVLPVCRAEMREVEVEGAPWECRMGGEFGVMEAEKDWNRWVVLPGWGPVSMLRNGGVAVAFKNARGVLPWKNMKRDMEEEILVVADRGRKEVEFDDGCYLVVSDDEGKKGLKVERGSKLKEMKVEMSLGTVVMVVRPPREEVNEQLGDGDWE